jgi:glycosyltransferase involved in cell wall biosynthesis
MVTTVSVVVPTRDRPAAVERCLDALAGQQLSGCVEIIIVDDGSTDVDGVASVVAQRPLARLVRIDGVGPAAARNAGVRAARGDIICFTDDDCEPAADWVACLVRAIESGTDAVGGATVSGCVDDPFAEASELIVRELQASTHRRLTTRVFIPTNNLACHRSLALAYPFDETYSVAGGEDRAWCARIAAAGFTFALVPDAVVTHRPTLGLRGFWRQHARYGRGAFRFARMNEGREWREPTGFYVGLLRAGLQTGVRCSLLVALAQLATGVGFVTEAIGEWRRPAGHRIRR